MGGTPLVSFRQLQDRIGKRAFGIHGDIGDEERFAVWLIMRAAARRNGCRRLLEKTESLVALWYMCRQRDVEPNAADWLRIAHCRELVADVEPGRIYAVPDGESFKLLRRHAA
jgi:hypothetical protein